MNFLIVGAGGFFGAVARYFVYTILSSSRFGTSAFATLSVNIAGCFALGVVNSVLKNETSSTHPLALLVSVGFIGAFTTFSAFTADAVFLANSGRANFAGLYVAASIGFGILAFYLGRAI